MARRRMHEDHVNHEAWAIPYGDLITLLLAFFVVMYAISSVNEGKYRVVSDSLKEAFGGHAMSINPILVGDPMQAAPPGAHGGMLLPPVEFEPIAALPPRPAPLTQQASREAIDALESAQRQREAMQQERLGALARDIEDSLAGLIGSGDIAVRRNPLFLEVEMRTDILFESGSALLQGQAATVVGKIATTLAPFANPVKVEGHTDDQPIASAQFPSNWELSAARAASVVKLFVAGGVAPTRVAVVGYGAERPKAGNDSPAGRNQNRRVVLVILAEPEADEVDDLPSTPAPVPVPPSPLASRGTDRAPEPVGGLP